METVHVIALDIRDHFAAQAMQAIMQSEYHMDAASTYSRQADITIQESICALAYVQADAMIIERDKKKQQELIDSGKLSTGHGKSK